MTIGVLTHVAAELPDPGRLATITFAGTLGTVVGAPVAELRDLPPDRAGAAMRIGLILGFAAGLAGWVVSAAMNVL